MVLMETAVVVDIGGTTTRIAAIGQDLVPRDCLRLTTRPWNRTDFFDEVCAQVRRRLPPRGEETIVCVSFGAVLRSNGVVVDASVLWGELASGFDVVAAMRSRLPDVEVFVVNDVTAMAWRFANLDRFVLVTVSTGIGAKLFDVAAGSPLKVVQNADGLGGEMGHVCVDPLLVSRAMERLPEVARSLAIHRWSDPSPTHRLSIGRAAADGDPEAQAVLEALGVPWCACGNLADLGSYASGPGTVAHLRMRARADHVGFAASALHLSCQGQPELIDTARIGDALREGDHWTEEGVSVGIQHLALRLLQLAADVGVDRIVVTGGFANGVGEPWFRLLRRELRALAYPSGFFAGWDAERFDNLILPSPTQQDDALIGAGALAFSLASQRRVVTKPPGSAESCITHVPREAVGYGRIRARVHWVGVCGTDLQILRGERNCEPGVLGHECVAEVLEIGRGVSGLTPGQWFTLNPNNPLDPHDKIGHNRPGVFRDELLLDHELLARGQVVVVPPAAGPEWVMVELLACVLHAQSVLGVSPGSRVLIAGSGVTAGLHAMVARHCQAVVNLVSPSSERLSFMAANGIVNPDELRLLSPDGAWTGHAADRYDHLILALAGSGGPQRLALLLPQLAHGAQVHLFGGFTGVASCTIPALGPLDVQSLREGETTSTHSLADGRKVRFVGSRGCSREDMDRAVALVGKEGLPLRRVVTQLICLERLPAVMAELVAHGTVFGQQALRVVAAPRLLGKPNAGTLV
jgi:threonine dehydrogenase-like Zn-dependent dehydrogenase/predicted NBD/HSP70 family sugar kinase